MIVKLTPYPTEPIMILWFESDTEYRNALWVRAYSTGDSQLTDLIRIAARNHAVRVESQL